MAAKRSKKKSGAKKAATRTATVPAPMMKWSINNMACVALWGALLTLAQSSRAFPNSANVRIGAFPIWVPGESSTLRRKRARMLATQIDNVLRGMNGAHYEEGSKKSKVLAAMTPVLTEDDKTIVQLADVVDDHYRFQGEPDA